MYSIRTPVLLLIFECVMTLAICSQDIPIPTLKGVFDAMKSNTHVQYLSIAATRSNDPVALVSAYLLAYSSVHSYTHSLTHNIMYMILLRITECHLMRAPWTNSLPPE